MRRTRRAGGVDARRFVVLLAAWWLWMPLVVVVWWAFINLFMSGSGQLHLGLWSWWDSWYAVDSGQRWFYLFVGAVGSVALAGSFMDDAPKATTVVAGLGVLLAVVAVVMFVRAVWDND
nr:hypothetical protein [Micromonospora sp. DSM 115978]